MEQAGGGYSQAQINVTPSENANIPSFLLRKYKGRPMVLRPGSKLLPSLDLLSATASVVGREVHVFLSPAVCPSDGGSALGPQTDDEPDDFYDFTAADYSQTFKYKKQDVFLKTRKMREQEEAARRARITKACIRVQFPDNLILEANFQSTDPVSLLYDLVHKVIQHPNLAFYLYTTPPKQRIKDLQQSMYSAGLAPGALVYFSYEAVKGQDANSESLCYLRPEIAALKDLQLTENRCVLPEPASQGIDFAAISLGNDSLPEKEPKRWGGKPTWFKR